MRASWLAIFMIACGTPGELDGGDDASGGEDAGGGGCVGGAGAGGHRRAEAGGGGGAGDRGGGGGGDGARDGCGEGTWARYEIAAGEHTAHLFDAVPKNPVQGITDAVGRDYELVLDPSAMYVLAMPVEPNDQLDWNKLPGLSDCGEIDLSKDGAMFGWRWRPEMGVLEVTAYANNGGVHLTTDVMFTLDAAALEAREVIRYRVWREAARYRFEARGVVAELPRRCVDAPLDPAAWAGAFYFGGTSTAPHPIGARIRERPFAL